MKKEYSLIIFTVIASIIAYFAITLLYPFDRDLDTYANISLILKSAFALFDIGMIVNILLHSNNEK